MKKLFICSLIILIILILATSGIASAMETKTYTGSATSSQPFIWDSITNQDGNFVVHVTWLPKKNGNYIFQVFHFTNPEDPYNSRDWRNDCTMSTYYSSPNGDWVCILPNAPAGYYRVYFKPYNGPVYDLQFEQTAETD